MKKSLAKWCFHYSPKKRRFQDELDAQIELTMIRVRGSRHRREQGYYYHKLCDGWHLTSAPRKLDSKASKC